MKLGYKCLLSISLLIAFSLMQATEIFYSPIVSINDDDKILLYFGTNTVFNYPALYYKQEPRDLHQTIKKAGFELPRNARPDYASRNVKLYLHRVQLNTPEYKKLIADKLKAEDPQGGEYELVSLSDLKSGQAFKSFNIQVVEVGNVEYQFTFDFWKALTSTDVWNDIVDIEILSHDEDDEDIKDIEIIG